MNSQGQVVVVGGSKGLGKAVSERFATQGYVVTVIARSRPSSEVVMNHVTVDLESMTSGDASVAETIRIGGKVKYLIFCQRYRGSGDSWIGEIQVTLTATRLLINAFADYFVSVGDRAIAVVSSVYAEFIGGSQPDGYHVAKAGLNQLVKYNAWVLGRKGIRVNAILPLTYVKPESEEFYFASTELMKLYQEFVPIGRIGHVENSTDLLEFLCSEKANFINGQAIYVDGGVSIIWPEEIARSKSTHW
jgi:NAD(P)-dependent dehydrogenase (short-subunit alcohol dehydrogenase family)